MTVTPTILTPDRKRTESDLKVPLRTRLEFFASGRAVTGFVFIAFALQIGLFTLGNTGLRLPLRCGVYGVSLGFAYLTRGRFQPHPAWRWAQIAIVILAFGSLNPNGDGLVARLACVVLYSSVLAPLLWIGRLAVAERDFRNVLRLMWAFYAASAVFGVLQINYPGRYDGALSANYDKQSMLMHTFTLADGRKIIRPKGLTDTPGGASAGGVNAIIIGAGLLLTETSLIVRGLTMLGMLAGLFCIYICQGRTSLVVIGLAMVALQGVLLRRGMLRRAAGLMSVLGGVAFLGTVLAFAVGGSATSDRFYTLIAGDPASVVQANRGQFVDDIVQHSAYEFPFGAGQGRWGMVNSYFGSANRSLWAEMLWQALLYDGGISLILVYAGIFGSLSLTAWRLATSNVSDVMGCWAGVVLGYDVAATASSFVFPNLAIQVGMEVILLNACLYAACRTVDLPERAARIEGASAAGLGPNRTTAQNV